MGAKVPVCGAPGYFKSITSCSLSLEEWLTF